MLLVLAAIVVGAGVWTHVSATRRDRARLDAGLLPQPSYEHPTNGAVVHGVTGGPITRGRSTNPVV